MMKNKENQKNYINSIKNIKFEIKGKVNNILSYFSSVDNISCIKTCLDLGIEHTIDHFDFTPLKYSLDINSPKAVELFI